MDKLLCAVLFLCNDFLVPAAEQKTCIQDKKKKAGLNENTGIFELVR